ncbi:hypothetical protein [Streptomyces sp. Ac-502]|uniref:hypothetical protein n=1 Tax=Streptomyces sp. Ac-502 TaxID=3342801 RepID=UPI00386227B6
MRRTVRTARSTTEPGTAEPDIAEPGATEPDVAEPRTAPAVRRARFPAIRH